MCSKTKITIDKWTILDTMSAVLIFGAVFLMKYVNPNDLLDPNKKEWIDYFMIFVLCISWLRFFFYFLVVKQISTLLLTLISMVWDTLSFLFIICCFLVIMASIFTTLF